MKILNTLQELWEYFEFCPICQDFNRKVDQLMAVSVLSPVSGPILPDVQYIKHPYNLLISGSIKIGTNTYSSSFNIDCIQNTFYFDLKEFISFTNTVFPDRIAFYLGAECLRCNCSHINSYFFLDINNNTVCYLKPQKEVIHLLSEIDKFHIQLRHSENKMAISRYHLDDIMYLGPKSIVDDNKVIILPMVPLDFTDIPKVVKRIKTMITFS